MINIKLNKGKSIYFSSDNHLGAPNSSESIIREKLFLSWLDIIKKDAQVIFLLGDLFDFWFEYYNSIHQLFEIGYLAPTRALAYNQSVKSHLMLIDPMNLSFSESLT